MYEELKYKIMSRFGETVDVVEGFSEYYHKTAGFGIYGFLMSEHNTIRVKRKIAGLFNYEFSYAQTDEGSRRYYAEFNEGDKTYKTGRAGIEDTAIMIGMAYEFDKEYIIPDIMIVATLKELLSEIIKFPFRNEKEETYFNIRQLRELVNKATKELKENRFRLTKNAKYFALYEGNTGMYDMCKLLSSKKLNADDYCNYIYDRLKWYMNDNNFVTFSHLSTELFQFVKNEEIISDHIRDIKRFYENAKKEKKPFPNLEVEKRLLKIHKEEIASFPYYDDFFPRRYEKTQAGLQETEKILSEAEDYNTAIQLEVNQQS